MRPDGALPTMAIRSGRARIRPRAAAAQAARRSASSGPEPASPIAAGISTGGCGHTAAAISTAG